MSAEGARGSDRLPETLRQKDRAQTPYAGASDHPSWLSIREKEERWKRFFLR